MTDICGDQTRWAELRRRAEAALDDDPTASGPLAAAEGRALIQDLRVAQAELEIQNEELREAQHSLERSRRHFETLFHAAPVGYVVLDHIGMIRQVNEMFCQMVGLAAEQLKQRSLRSHVAAEHQAAFDRRFPALFRGRTPRVIETRLVHGAEQRQLDVRMEGTVIDRIPGAEDRESRLVVAVSDITEAKSLEKQLWESQKLETVGRLAGGIAHDFNNALTVIQGTIDVARFDLDPGSPQDVYLRQIESATTRASALVQQLLAFAHKGVAVPRLIDLRDVLAAAEAMLSRLLPESIVLRWSVAPDLHHVHIDPVQVDQMLTNLVLNARDAVGARGTIEVTCRNTVLDRDACRANPNAIPGAYVAVTVADDGIGMDAVTRDRACEPFFTTKPQGKGSGLGLSTVYGIVAQNRGILEVESAPGRGSRFTINLPRADGEFTATETRRAADDRLRGDERILLVEDNPEILSLAKRLLGRKGYQVEAFDHPEAALTWFEEHPHVPDLVLTDVVMPDLSGPALVERLQRRRPDLRSMYMSGYPKDEVTGRRLREADIVFVSKPFDSVTLLTAVRRALGDGIG
ncbi:MAG: response regulator [Candidatus Krumholzibacteriia bacterium]